MRLRYKGLERLREAVKANRFISLYTQGLKSEDVQRLFTRDTVDAYRFFARGIDPAAIARLPWYRRAWAHTRLFFLAFTLKLSPARRLVYAFAVLFALAGVLKLARLGTGAPVAFVDGTLYLLLGFLLTNLLVLLEVADRLSLKNDLDIAREIQQQMLPGKAYRVPGVVAFGRTRPANTVGGDFYDILRAPDGRILVAVGDVAGKGSPAALLMALLLAIFRTLVDEGIDLGVLVDRLNRQVARHAPPSRFITFFVAALHPATGEMDYVNAGHLPPLVWRHQTGSIERWTAGGIALGMFEQSQYHSEHARLGPGDVMVLYSDGVTEAENAAGQPFEEEGLAAVVRAYASAKPEMFADAVFRLVEQHTNDARITDDLTILALERVAAAASVAGTAP